MHIYFSATNSVLLRHGKLFLDCRFAGASRSVASQITIPIHQRKHLWQLNKNSWLRLLNTTTMSAPIPIIRRGVFLTPLSLTFQSSKHERVCSSYTPSPMPSPMPSPPSTPPLPESPSGLLQYAKDSLVIGVSKRDGKSSSLSIDEDMRDMCYYYTELGPSERSSFVLHMATSLATNHDAVYQIVLQRPQPQDTHNEDLSAALMKWEERLRQALQPSHHWVASQVSRLSGGVKFLVDMRQDILSTIYGMSADSPGLAALKSLDYTLRELLGIWFTVGLLNLQRITWDSSCDMLQKVSQYEAVHPVRNWSDLKRRVGPYRRCFVFTHSCMPNEPLVVLHTYLTNEISNTMSNIVKNPRSSSIDERDEKFKNKSIEDPNFISTAIFYSITSTQKGLQGIELGNYMIKRVVRELKAEFPQMSQFSSLSPIPGYSKWLSGILVQAQRGEQKIFTDSELENLQILLELNSVSDLYDKLRKLFSTNGWIEDDALVIILEMPLMRLCAQYLYIEKRRGYCLDSVANFHLKNGAIMWRINWKADWSPRGLTNSCGIMVNYRYFLEECENNSKQYLETAVVLASDTVAHLSKVSADILAGSQGDPNSSPMFTISPPPKINIIPDSKM